MLLAECAAMLRSSFALVLLAACDPLYTLNATVEIPDAAAGKSMIVVEYDGATWDGVHLPVLEASGNKVVMIAKPADAISVETSSGGLGCPSDVYVAAWIDLTGKSGLDAVVAGQTWTYDSNDYAVLQHLEQLAPAPGDLLGVSGPLQFGSHAGCKTYKLATTVTLAPAT
jgi:hypothetical protein